MNVLRTIPATLATAMVLAASPASAAGAPGEWTPPTLTQPRLTLAEAVRLTLENDPNIRVAEQRMLGQQGAFQIRSGQFDPLLTGSGSYTFTQQALTLRQRQEEEKKRTDLQKDIGNDQTKVNEAQADLTDLQKLAANPDTYQATRPGLIFVQVQVNDFNRKIAAEPDPAKRALLIAARAAYLQTSLDEFRGTVNANQGALERDQTRLAKYGSVPREVLNEDVALSLNLALPYRDGVTVGLFADGTYSASRYKGKTKLEEEGGLGIEDLYKYEIGFSVDAALLRGRGVDATGAFEKAAGIDYEASRLAFEHQATQSVLTTVAAYWNLAQAQELYEVMKGSVALHGRRLDVTRALIQGDELPRAELSRELASQASDEALLQSSERSLTEARLALARAIGIQVTSEAEAPLAADPLPEQGDLERLRTLAPAPLIAQALDARADRRSAAKLRESGGVLVRAAETALRPRLDASGKISAGTVSETSLAKTSSGWSAPSFAVSLNFEAPIGNNEAKGRLAQTQADLAQRSIYAADLDRNIRANVVQTLATLRSSAEQLARVKDAVGLYGKTIDAEGERFRAGQSSLLDAIVTQDLRTSVLFNYTVARQQYATLLARLRYETGTLVTREGNHNVVRPGDLLTLPAVGK